MAGKPGRSGRKLGSVNYRDQPFADALRMEIAAADGDLKKLRKIAAVLIDKAESGDLQAIQQIADRLDGKPAQHQNININDKRTPFDWTREEIQRRLAESIAKDDDAGNAAPNGRGGASDSVH